MDQGNKRRMAARGAVAAGLLTLLILSGSAQPASAGATNCTAYPGGWSSQICNSTKGVGLNVISSQVYRSDPKRLANFCEYQAKLWYYATNGTKITRYSSFTPGCTYPPRAWKDFSVQRNLKNGTKICGAWREDGRDTYPGSYACNNIHS